MDLKTFIIALISLVSWGMGSFIAKLATNRIGERAVFWDMLGYAPVVVIYSIIAFKIKNLFSADINREGIILAILAGMIGSFGLVAFYFLLTKKDASNAVPLTALYPALTAILAFIFLKEKLTLIKAAGILLATFALYLLSL